MSKENLSDSSSEDLKATMTSTSKPAPVLGGADGKSSGSVFRLEADFVKQLRNRILEQVAFFSSSHSKQGITEDEIVPTLEQLEEIILAMFWASLKPEEGRLSRFRITFAEPLPLNYLSLIFERPKRLTVEELRKLAPAVLPPDGQVVVWPHGEKGELHIWGLQTTDLARVTFEAVEPGRLIVSYPHFKIAEITGQRSGFISSGWNREGLELMSAYEGKGKSVSIVEALSFFKMHTTEEVLSRMRLLGHGGALIFVPESRRWQRSVEQPMVYACDQNLNQVGRIVEHFVESLEKVAGKGETGDGRIRIMDQGMKLITSPEYKAFVGDAARSIAYLSAVDGATILNENFEVLAFGAKLKAPKRGARAETVVRVTPLETDSDPEEVPIDHEFRGTRHLSAAQFVFNNPDSVAFVVSQDGGITGLAMGELDGKEPRPVLLAYRELELLL